MDFGINMDRMIYRFSNGQATGAFMVGFRAGYRVSAASDHWKKDIVAESNNIAFANNAWYITVCVGAGNFRKTSVQKLK